MFLVMTMLLCVMRVCVSCWIFLDCMIESVMLLNLFDWKILWILVLLSLIFLNFGLSRFLSVVSIFSMVW